MGGRLDVFDAYSGEQFNMRAMLFCTINDFPAYGHLSGYTVKGIKRVLYVKKTHVTIRLKKEIRFFISGIEFF